ncbi:MAG: hypothetical protein E7E32_06845 [Anaerococcus hydrogenalis]|nr:hypothetical protein [Anaerococcus hydrogenalis]
MKNYIIEKLRDYSKSNEKVKAIYFVKEDNNNEYFANIYAVYSDIIISKIKEKIFLNMIKKINNLLSLKFIQMILQKFL